MRKLRKFIVAAPTGTRLSVKEMQGLSGGSSSNSIDIYECTCYLTMPCGCVFTKEHVFVKATSQSAAESGVLRSKCEGYTSASCHFYSHLDGTH